MYRFFRWYNQNRLRVIVIVAVVLLAFVVLQIVNSLVARHNEEERNMLANRNTYIDKTTNPNPTNTSVLTGEKIPDSQDTINKNLISQFVEYCNTGEIQKAYDMLSDECKELIYPTVDLFKQIYINNIFYINRMYSLQNWYIDNNSYTYYIKYTEDVLATGNVNSDNNKGDYITIVNKEGAYYLNINNYVGRQGKNKTVSNNNITISVNWIDMYIDYTICNITVKNNTGKTVCIDTKEDVLSTYIYDSNNVKYTSFINENPLLELIIRDQESKTINIKFNKLYNQSRILTGITFQDIVLNYDEYISNSAGKESISADINIK